MIDVDNYFFKLVNFSSVLSIFCINFTREGTVIFSKKWIYKQHEITELTWYFFFIFVLFNFNDTLREYVVFSWFSWSTYRSMGLGIRKSYFKNLYTFTKYIGNIQPHKSLLIIIWRVKWNRYLYEQKRQFLFFSLSFQVTLKLINFLITKFLRYL